MLRAAHYLSMTTRPLGRRGTAGLGVGILAGSSLLSACGGGTPGRTVVDTRVVGSLGSILTTPAGQVLYMFPPDAERQVTCVDACALAWPPLTVEAGIRPRAGPGVEQSLIGTVPDPGGGPPVITYDGWPLYTYREDIRPGVASGQGVYLNGGYWYVMSAAGQPLTVTS